MADAEDRAAPRAVGTVSGPWARPDRVDGPEGCTFYHSIEIPGEGFFPGPFDLRDTIGTYLGGVDVKGRRVLEIGPANGFVTFHLEASGAAVAAVDVSEEFLWDTVPYPRGIVEPWRSVRLEHLRGIRRAFWLAHSRLGSRARVHYGNAADLPPDLGRFDVSVLAMVLLHNRDPLGIVAACAERTEETMVIVDQYDERLAGTGLPAMTMVPTATNGQTDTWWHLSPILLEQLLEIHGFGSFETTLHEIVWHPVGSDRPEVMPCFTLVASGRPPA